MPAECDVPLRKGWFFHETEQPKTVDQLFDLYLKSVGRGAGLDLGLAPDTRGLLHDDDVASLKAFGDKVKQTFTKNLASNAAITADNNRGIAYAPSFMLDRDKKSYWATSDKDTEGTITLTFKEAVTFDIISLQEYIPLGQRIDKFTIEVLDERGQWKQVAGGASIGAKRLVKINQPITANKLRLKLSAPVSITLCELGVYKTAI